ncbi:MAG: class I SAM-dependent methyltransferase [Candidatus Paceibacterota bacterium]|jgi:cyclopropane fatty-acyl-phospholipid synthase-like methyltransferase
MNITNDDLVKKYDDYYTENPNKWDTVDRDKFCFDVMSNYQFKNILDVGCGNGHLLKYFDNNMSGVTYAGIDLSPVACELARGKVPAADIRLGVLGEIEFDKKFDAVVLLGVIEHLDMEDVNHTKSLADIRNLMAPGGVLYIEAPNCIAYKKSEHFEGFRQLNQGSRQYEWHLFRPTWEKIFKAAGFEIVESITSPVIQWEFIWVLR